MKKNITILCSILFAYIPIYAQLLGSIKFDPKEILSTTPPDSIASKATFTSVAIIKQSYQIKDKKKGQVFGRDGRNDFGHSYSLAIKTEAGLILTDIALQPWLYDEDFKKVEKDYEPIISLTEMRNIHSDGNVKFKQTPLKIGQEQPNGIWLATTEDPFENSLAIDAEDGQKDGCIIWFCVNQNIDKNPNAKVFLKTSQIKMDVKESRNYSTVGPPAGQELVLGGIFVRPVFLGSGQVIYKLVGVATKDENDWRLCTPFVGFVNNLAPKKEKVEKSAESIEETKRKEAIPEGENIEKELELTPIKQNKKKKNREKK